MRRAVFAVVCAILILVGRPDARPRRGAPQLVQVVTPAGRAAVPAHPDVNIIVRFLAPRGGTTLADPATFRARLGARDITDRFVPIIEQGTQVGVRATIPHDRVRISRRRSNRLRVLVRSRQGGKKGRNRQIVRLRFRAMDADNQPPVATIVPDSEIVFPNLALGFDASHSFDPESDALTYQWDFGDGTTSTDIKPTHTYADADQPRTVTLAVSDGQATTTATLMMRSCPQPEGATPGTIQVTSDAPLEFDAVAPGASATRTFVVKNAATDPASRLGTCIGLEGSAFSVSPESLDLGPGESAPVTVTFAPAAEGHASAKLALVSPAVSTPLVPLLAHGYGGSAPGHGPTLASRPLLYTYFGGISGDLIKGFLPNGTPIAPNLGVHSCGSDVSFSSGDACVVDADCAVNGGTCQQSSPSGLSIDEVCGDGSGLVFLSEDGFTDPTDNDPALTGTLVRVALDANGNATGSAILARLTEDTTHLACDGFSAGDGGRVYVAEAEAVPEVDTCFRDTEESLIGVRKSDGNFVTLMPRIDAAEGVSECDDLDPTTHIEVSADGSQFFASFEGGFNSGGLWRLRPTPLQFLDSSYFEDQFRLHPDGSILFATVQSGPTTAIVKLFRVTPSEVAAGPLPEAGVTPCASFQLPNRKDAQISSFRLGFAVAPPAQGSRDGVVLITASAPSRLPVADPLTVRATIAFSAPADSAACTPIGIINLEGGDTLAF